MNHLPILLKVRMENHSLLLFTWLLVLTLRIIHATGDTDQKKLFADTSNKESDIFDIKRAGFLPARGRRFWSIFDWDDISDRKEGFLPMRGRKAGFLPMRGKKENDFVAPLLDIAVGNEDDYSANELSKRAYFMPMRGKKYFTTDADDLYEQWPLANVNQAKRVRAFFGTRGKRSVSASAL